MKRYVLLGLLFGLLVLFPHLALLAALCVRYTVVWLAGQPTVWAFAAGAIARPRIARHVPRRLR